MNITEDQIQINPRRTVRGENRISDHVNLSEAIEYEGSQNDALTNNYISTISFMAEYNYNLVFCWEEFQYRMNNIAVLRRYNDRYVYEIEINRSISDIITNFESNVEIVVTINDQECSNIENLVLIPFLIHFHSIKVLFLFDENVQNFYLRYKSYLLDIYTRRILSELHNVQTDTHLYMHGFVGNVSVLNEIQT